MCFSFLFLDTHSVHTVHIHLTDSQKTRMTHTIFHIIFIIKKGHISSLWNIHSWYVWTLFRNWGHCVWHGESGQGQHYPDPGVGGAERDSQELGQQSPEPAAGQGASQSGLGKRKSQIQPDFVIWTLSLLFLYHYSFKLNILLYYFFSWSHWVLNDWVLLVYNIHFIQRISGRPEVLPLNSNIGINIHNFLKKYF